MKPSKTPLTQSLKIALYTTAAVSGAVSAAETELKSSDFTIPNAAALNRTTIASAEKVAQSLNVTNTEVNNNTTKVKALEAQVEQHGSIITMLEQQMTANNTNTITYIDDTKKKLETDVNNLGDALDVVRTQTGLQEGEINKLKTDLDNYVKADDFANIMTEVGNELDNRFGDINDELNKKINTEDAQKLLDAQIGNVTDRIDLVDDKVEALNTQVQGKADKNLVDDVITTLNDKADRSELADKANQSDLDNYVKADDFVNIMTEVGNELDNRFGDINDELNKKINTEDAQKLLDAQIGNVTDRIDLVDDKVEALNTQVQGKADKNLVDDVITTLNDKADRSELADKANQSDLDNYVKADDFVNIMTEVGNELDNRFGDIKATTDDLNENKADKSEITRLDNDIDQTLLAIAELAEITNEEVSRVDNKVDQLADATKQSFENVKATTDDLNENKADKSELARVEKGAIDSVKELATITQDAFARTDAEVAKKADQTALDETNQNLEKLNGKIDEKTDIATVQGLLDAQIGNVNGRIDSVDKTIAQLDDKKADKTEVATVKNTADTAKQIADTALTGLSEKANVVDVNNQLAQKADQSDLDELKTKTGEMIGELAEITRDAFARTDAEVAKKANQSDLENLKNATEANIAELQDFANATADAFQNVASDMAQTNNRIDENATAIDELEKIAEQLNKTADDLATKKADQTALDETNQKLNTYAHELYTKVGENIADINGLKADKADKTAVNAELAKKADQTALNTTNDKVAKLEANKADKTALAETDKKVTDLEANKADKAETEKALADNKTAIENTNAKLDTYAHELYTKVGENIADINGLKADKADKTAVNAELAKKADTATVNAELAKKADQTALNTTNDKVATLEANKADKTAVNAELAKKADTAAVNAELAKKADKAETEKALADNKTAIENTNAKLDTYAHELYTKVGENIADINGLKADKADKTAVNAELAKKADTATVNAELAKKADKAETEKALADNKTAIENTNAKLDTYAHELYTKVGENIADINGLKADKADKTALAETDKKVADLETNKADKTAVNAELAKKADQTALNTTNDKVAKLETSKADKADIDNKIKGLETQFATEQATINNTATNALNTANAAVASAANAGTTATNALNAANANTVRINGIEQQVGGLNARMGEVEKRLGDLDNDFKSGMATQAALNGLFQPYTIGRANTSIAIGGYDSKTAIAIGAGYRFNEKIATKAAFSTDGSNASYNLGVNFEW